MDNNSGFDNRMNQATQNVDNSNQNASIQEAQQRGNLAKDSSLYQKSSGLGSNAKRNDSKGLGDSSESTHSRVPSNSSLNSSSSSSQNISRAGSINKPMNQNKPFGSFGNPMSNKRKNSLINNPLTRMIPGVKTANTLSSILQKNKTKSMLSSKFNAQGQADANLEGNSEDQTSKNKEQADPTEPANKKSENKVEEISIRIPFKVKIALLVATCTLAICMLLLISIINTDTIQKLIANRFSVKIFDDKNSAADIDENGNNSGEWVEEESHLSKNIKIYSKNNFIDDEVVADVQFTTYKSSKDVDLTNLKEYYKINCSGDACEETSLYKFYRKMYDIYFMYKYKYGVKIDLPLLMSTLDYNAKSHEKMFNNHQSDYDKEAVRENDYDNENVTILDWENDFKNLEGYTYLNANDFRYDMQILAKNMVRKKITYKCKDGNGNYSGDDDGDSKSRLITDGKEKGNGFDSVTKIKYNSGVERTYRNYKQSHLSTDGKNDYYNYPYWEGTIESDGCGPTAVAIILSGYGYDYNPRDVVKKMSSLGIKYTSSSNLLTTVKSYKIKAELKSWSSNSEKEIKENFAAGRPVIMGVSLNGAGHYVTFLGLDKKGKLILSDPGRRDSDNNNYGSTISEVKSKNSSYQYILIKSNGNASTSSSNSNNNSSSSNTSSSSSSSGSGAGKVIQKSNYNSKGGYSGIYESRITGKRFKEYKQNSSWAISKFPNVQWTQECGKISALTIGSGYSKKATYSNLYNNILKKGSDNSAVYEIIDKYTNTTAKFQSMISISKLKKYLSKGYVASIHVSGYPSTSTHYLSILDINKKQTKIYLSDPWGGSSYSGWKDISIVNTLGAHEICLVPSNGKVVNYSGDDDSNNSDNSSEDSDSKGTKTMNDIETSNYDKKLKCEDGYTVDKDSIKVTYKLDKNKYDEFLLEYIEHKFFLEGTKVDKTTSNNSGNVSGSGKLSYSKTNKKLCKGSITPGVYQSSEPCPNQAILYWKKYLKQSDFVFPLDDKTGLPLGAWPKNYAKYPSQLTNYKTYHKYYIWPITPVNNTYTTVYNHRSMDIMATFGTPVYSPVDGTLLDSEWGGTINRGSDETAYSITIKPNNVVKYGGTSINEIFFTHMSGIRYRCSWGKCNRKIKKGELLGFSGNAAGSSTSVGWAPHLHLTYYNSSSYDGTALWTPTVEKFYNIKNNTKRKVGE